MSHRAMRVLCRPWSISLVLVLGAALGLVVSVFSARIAQAQSADRLAVVLRFIEAENQGDADTAAAQFATTAVFIGARATGNCSIQSACTDRAGIHQQIEGNIGLHNCSTVRSLQVSGAVVTGVREIQTDLARANGVARVVQGFMMLVPNDQITYFAAVTDPADAQTALNAAITAGTQPAGTALDPPASCPSML